MPGTPRKRAAKAVVGPTKAVPIRSTRRNTARDREFIEDNKYHFKVYEGQLVWDGRAEDIGSPFVAAPDEKRCIHDTTRRDDEGKAILDKDLKELKIRCPKWGMILGDGLGTLHLCAEHAGGVAGVRRAITERFAAAGDAIAGRLIRIALNEYTADGDAIRAIEKILDRIGVRGGVEVSPDVPGWQKVWQDLSAAEEERDGDADA